MTDLKELYDSYASDVYRFAFWLSGDPTEAEDITSETFVRAWAKKTDFRTETLKAYLLKIARNAYLERLRKKRRLTELEDVHIDPSPGPYEQVESNQELTRITKLLQGLPENDRAAFVMRVQHELPYAEIARVLELSLAAVKVKIHRVRKRILADRLEREENRS